MSEIDQYKHECIGIIVCPSTYPVVGGREHRNIPLYRIDEAAEEWDAKSGDLLLGGGSGEFEALRISMPEPWCSTRMNMGTIAVASGITTRLIGA